MITSNTARAGHISRVLTRCRDRSGRESGLLMDSVIMTDNLATVHDHEIDRVLGTLPDLAEVDAALRMTLAL
jgi:mRNA interferase MazF